MTDLARINDEVITSEDFIKLLKLTGRYDSLMEDILKDKLAVHAAKRQKIPIQPEELQERADQLRRVWGLHRAADTNKWLDAKGLSLDDLERFVTEMIYHEKAMEKVADDAAVEAYFNLNSPKFDAIDISHIVTDSEGKARELLAILEDDPEEFPEMAREHSLSDTREEGGYIGKVLRGALLPEVEGKVFNAQVGELLGPFPSPDENLYEIFIVNDKRKASLDDETREEVRRIVRDEWLAAQAREHGIELL
ncbi:MAG: peptidylprolyl isomerase [Candidatus Thiodiazotropha sp.]